MKEKSFKKSLIFFAFFVIYDYNQVFILYRFSMKKSIYWYIILWLFLFVVPFATPLYAQEDADKDTYKEPDKIEDRSFSLNPVQVLQTVKNNANRKKSQEVQNTEYDNVTSRNPCDNIKSQFTISRTLCSIKQYSRDYIQYIMYIWLTAATIFLIWNGFKIVTSSDREKQISTFKTNLKYIVIWVLLLTSFYYIIDIFVSVINAIIG